MLESLLGHSFMLRALIAGVAVGFLASYYGVFVVQRGLSFLGDGLAHAAFGGVALGILLQTEPLWVAVPFTVLVAVAITWVRDRTKLGSDTVIGIFFAISMALGIVFLSFSPGFAVDAFAYLFGSILFVSWIDVYIILAVAAVSLLTFFLWGRWSYTTFDREMAAADRLPVRRDDYLLSVLIAVTVVASVKLVGIVLVSAFLVIPAATARLVSRGFAAMTLLAIVFGVSTAVGGLAASAQMDIPSGATIVLAQGALFVVCLLMANVILPKLAGEKKPLDGQTGKSSC